MSITWPRVTEGLTADAGERVLFVFARPLDETLLAGGTIAALIASGAAVTVLIATDGGVADPAELQLAVSALGVTDLRMLGTADARIRDAGPRAYLASGTLADETRHGTLLEADRGEVAADIATVIASTGALAVISYDEAGADGHPDRVAVHDAARHAAAVLEVPFFWTGGQPGRRGRTVDVSSVLHRKRLALKAYGAADGPDGTLRWPDGSVERFDAAEVFTPAGGTPEVREWDDLGVGARIAATGVALLVGAAIGGLGTVVYQAGFALGPVAVPAGLIGALVVVAAVLAGLRIALRTRVAAAAAAVGVLAAIAVLSMESAGGSILVPAAPLSYYWLYGPVVIALIVLAWPDLRRRDTPVRRGKRASDAG